MNWFTSPSFHVAGESVSLRALVLSLVVLFLGFVAASNVGSRIRRWSDGRPETHRWRTTFAQIVGHGIRLISIVLALQVSGINVASLLAAGAVVAVGVGIAMQKVAENFVSGIILVAERSIREGDVIEFEGRVARVQQMGIRSTIAQTLDDEEIIVPNSLLTQSAVKNFTLTDLTYRLRVRVGVDYGSDVDRVVDILTAVAEAIPWRVQAKPPVVVFSDFAPSSLDFEVSVWTHDPWTMRRGQSALRREIWSAFRSEGIRIPFPQLDIHVDRDDALGGKAPTPAGALP
ncbi:MAG: mechanosensitive ion channel [Polyangiaceae bacterium]